MIIAVHGMIGCGKTTLVKNIERHYKVTGKESPTFLYEPVKENPFLDKYYVYPELYASAMQNYLISSRVEQAYIEVNNNKDKLIISDMSVLGGFIYVNHMHNRGEIDDLDFNALKKMENLFLEKERELLPDVIIYLTATREAIFDRIFKRGRECEQNIDNSFIDSLMYFNMDYHEHLREKGFNVIEIDTTHLSDNDVFDKVKGILDTIL